MEARKMPQKKGLMIRLLPDEMNPRLPRKSLCLRILLGLAPVEQNRPGHKHSTSALQALDPDQRLLHQRQRVTCPWLENLAMDVNMHVFGFVKPTSVGERPTPQPPAQDCRSTQSDEEGLTPIWAFILVVF